jgi:hypothetical protein
MQRPSEFDTGIAPPPRILLIAAFIALYFILLLGAALITWLINERRLIAIVPVALIGALIFVALSLLGALIFRRGLPKLFFLWLLLAYVVLGAVGAVGGVAVYRTVLPPRYQEELGTLLPFIRGFLPPTPEGGIIPTAAVTSPISAESLLNMPLLGVTAAPSAEPALESTAETRFGGSPLVSLSTETPTPPPTDTPQPTSTPTSLPTDLPPPTAEPTEILPTLAATARAIDRPAAARMYGFIHVQQTWNNCGPANVTMALSFYGWRQPQTFAQQWLKPDTEDKNVTPAEIVNFVNTQTQVKAITRIGGDMELLKDFIAANIPVIVETSYQFEGYDWIGHYQTVVGYDDNARIFYVYDSYLGAGENGAGIPEPYDRFDRVWQNFNRAFIAIYEPNREALVAQILGHRADVTAAAEHALLIAQQEARANPSDAFAWFNMGSSLVELGRYEEAAAAYDRATLAGLPFRITWYQFGSFKAYYEVGRYQDVLALVNTNLTNGAQYVEETHYWQGRVFAAQGRLNEAAAAFRRALSHNPRFEAARAALNTISS